MITVTFIDKNGSQTDKQVSEGTKISAVGGSDLSKLLLNSQTVTRDVELRDGDEVQVIAPTGKQE